MVVLFSATISTTCLISGWWPCPVGSYRNGVNHRAMLTPGLWPCPMGSYRNLWERNDFLPGGLWPCPVGSYRNCIRQVKRGRPGL